ncbi:Disease resistance protein [Penicillium pulvis]|uniref:Disease resistance protein n=1 Tax=Penicillium pulvis TaxID=1562058 RepID=UPI0025465B74|nr:Disease resistance protein [Penicillium pulvis]KAJ5798785.1 Disease resistance protein [Penicillium pulvis]
MEMLDEEHQPLPQSSGDTNIYNIGSINGHNVVIAGLTRAGNNPAATVVTQKMRMTFPNPKYGLLVGIGGGVPIEKKSGMIHLGHVVVSEPTGIHSGAVQYDHGKAISGHFQRKGFLAPPPIALLNATREMAVRRQRMDHDPIRENLQRIQINNRMLHSFKFPGAANDHLYPSNYEHQQARALCEGGCDPKRRNKRSVDEDDSFIVVHRGTIASGGLVMKDAQKRNELAQQYGVPCFETEAAGALADLSIFNSRLTFLGFLSIFLTSPKYPSVARQDELCQLHVILEETVGPRTAIVHGLGGIGMTQLALAYVKQNRGKYSAIIWLDSRDETALRQSFARSAEWILHHHPPNAYIASALDSRDLEETVRAVKGWLEETTNDRLLIVYDKYDSPLLENSKAKDAEHASSPNTELYSNEADDLLRRLVFANICQRPTTGLLV